MDFKGITWAGNIYQKFETMCLEVEEVMYEDTVKYVENQAQKVGASVKKFCAEVMQDINSPSCVDPVKVAAGELSLNPYAHTDTYKKPKSSIFDSHGDHIKKETDKMISDLTTEKPPLNDLNDFNSLSTLSPRVVVTSTNSKTLGIQKRRIGIKRLSQNNRPTKVSSPMTSLSEDGRNKLVNDTTSSCVVGSHAMKVTPSSGCVVRLDAGEPAQENKPACGASVKSPASNKPSSGCVVRLDAREPAQENKQCDAPVKPIASNKPSSGCVVRIDAGELAQENKPACGASVKPPASEKILSAESVRQKKDHPECTSSSRGSTENIGTSAKAISVSQPSSSFRTNNACEVESFGKDVMASKECKIVKVGPPSQLNSNVQSNKCAFESEGDNVIVSYEDSFDVEAIENAEVVEPRVEKSKLEETCVLVEADNLQFVSQGTQKHKSYKKKIREAISSKLRSTKKKGERISNYKDLDGKNNAGVAIGGPMTGSEKTKLAAQDSSESDWEIL